MVFLVPPVSHPCALLPSHIALLAACTSLAAARMGRLGVALALAVLATAVRAEEERGHCTAMGVGRKATSTGSTLLAHTDDRRAHLAHAAWA